MFNNLLWIGSVLLTLCAAPLAYDAYRDKKSELNTKFLLMWSAGEICMFIGVIPFWNLALFFNYGINIALLSIVWFYKVNQKDKQ